MNAHESIESSMFISLDVVLTGCFFACLFACLLTQSIDLVKMSLISSVMLPRCHVTSPLRRVEKTTMIPGQRQHLAMLC